MYMKSFFSILAISNSVQHDREDFRHLGGVVLGERGSNKLPLDQPLYTPHEEGGSRGLC